MAFIDNFDFILVQYLTLKQQSTHYNAYANIDYIIWILNILLLSIKDDDLQYYGKESNAKLIIFLGTISLQGEVTEYLVNVYSILENWTEHLSPGMNQTVLTDLIPNTVYNVTITLTINGGAAITSEPVTATTKDGGIFN